jgi:hypothetical protein
VGDAVCVEDGVCVYLHSHFALQGDVAFKFLALLVEVFNCFVVFGVCVMCCKLL